MNFELCTLYCLLPVQIRQDEIDAPQDRQKIGDHEPPRNMGHHLEMRERRRADARPVRHGASVAHEIVAVVPFRSLDAHERLSGWDHGPPAHAQEVVDERLDVMHGTFLARRRSERMVRLVGSRRHVLHALPDDAEALPDLFDADYAPVVTVAVNSRGDVELEVFVAGIRTFFAEIPLIPAGPKP